LKTHGRSFSVNRLDRSENLVQVNELRTVCHLQWTSSR
jgi:hypothetical protein